MIEFESKFKPSYKDKLEFLKNAVMAEEYIQTYFIDDDEREKRVRIHFNIESLPDGTKRKPHAILCEKKLIGIEDGIEIRKEDEEPIDIDSAINIALNNLSSTLIKKRYIVPFDSYKFEVDIYPEFTKIDEDMKDVNGTFVSIEVEFSSKEDRERFLTLDKPKWVGEDVSTDKRYSNRKLSKLPKLNSYVEDRVREFAKMKPKKKLK